MREALLQGMPLVRKRLVRPKTRFSVPLAWDAPEATFSHNEASIRHYSTVCVVCDVGSVEILRSSRALKFHFFTEVCS